MSVSSDSVFRLAAFADGPNGGNPAGVWFGDRFPDEANMQRVAADVGYSETAFVVPEVGDVRSVRYFSPRAEVPFCGHATIATGVLLGRRDGAGRYALDTPAGQVRLEVMRDGNDFEVALRSVAPETRALDGALLDEALDNLRLSKAQLDPRLPAAVAFAGASHPIIALADRGVLAALDYDYGGLTTLMLREGWTTAQIVHRERTELFHARNPFPVGGVVEDPATGAAAAALGGYLRHFGLVEVPRRVTILQGYDMGRPSRLRVDIPLAGGIVVTGSAVDI